MISPSNLFLASISIDLFFLCVRLLTFLGVFGLSDGLLCFEYMCIAYFQGLLWLGILGEESNNFVIHFV